MECSYAEGNCVSIILPPDTTITSVSHLLLYLLRHKEARQLIYQAAEGRRSTTWEAIWVDHESFIYPFLLERNTPDNTFVEEIKNQYAAVTPSRKRQIIKSYSSLGIV
jgi:hypothetical protein